MKNIVKNIVMAAVLCSLVCRTSAAEGKKTQVVIIGTIHSFHHKNPDYSPEGLKEIILSLKPDAILNELPLSLVDPNGRPIERTRSRDSSCPEIWAADTVATELGIKQIPFDRPDRQDHYKKTKKFERRKEAEEIFSKWYKQMKINVPDSVDLKINQLSTYGDQAEIYLFSNVGPENVNSEGFDAIVRIRHILWKEIRPEILKKYPGYKTLVEDYEFDYQEWQERNRIMADNIIKAAKQYPGGRLVVVTGAEHRYILRDLLKDEPSIDLKEYWQITTPDAEKAQQPEAAKQEHSPQAAGLGLTRDQRICGVARLWAGVKYNYALMEYAEVDWDQVLPEYSRLAERAKTDAEYYLLLEKMLALLKDNHTHLKNIPGRQNLHKPNIYLEIVEDQYVVTGFYEGTNSHPEVKFGDVVLAVDGTNAKETVEEVKPYIPASSETERVNRAFERMLWRQKDTDVVLTVKRGQKTFNVILPAQIPCTQRRWVAGFDFSYRLLENKYGYIRISNFWSERVVEDFNKAIEDLRECKGLILDLRDNGGGNENYGSAIAARLLKNRIYWYRPLRESFSLGLIYKKLQETKVQDVNDLRLKMSMSSAPSGPWQYHGPVVILVNWRTGSAAEGFVGALQDCGRAVIIGQQTSGGTGMPYYVDLPGGARGRICRNAHVRLDGSRFHGVGIKPDIPVKRTVKAITEGRDEVLEAAGEYLRSVQDANRVNRL